MTNVLSRLDTSDGVPRGDKLAVLAYLREAGPFALALDPDVSAKLLDWPVERYQAVLASLGRLGAVVDGELAAGWKEAPRRLKDPVGAARAQRYRDRNHAAPLRVVTRHGVLSQNNGLDKRPRASRSGITDYKPVKGQQLGVPAALAKAVRAVTRHGVLNENNGLTDFAGYVGNKSLNEIKEEAALQMETAASSGACPEMDWTCPGAEQGLDLSARKRRQWLLNTLLLVEASSLPAEQRGYILEKITNKGAWDFILFKLRAPPHVFKHLDAVSRAHKAAKQSRRRREIPLLSVVARDDEPEGRVEELAGNSFTDITESPFDDEPQGEVDLDKLDGAGFVDITDSPFDDEPQGNTEIQSKEIKRIGE